MDGDTSNPFQEGVILLSQSQQLPQFPCRAPMAPCALQPHVQRIPSPRAIPSICCAGDGSIPLSPNLSGPYRPHLKPKVTPLSLSPGFSPCLSSPLPGARGGCSGCSFGGWRPPEPPNLPGSPGALSAHRSRGWRGRRWRRSLLIKLQSSGSDECSVTAPAAIPPGLGSASSSG